MKITAQEEYGLRILLQVAKQRNEDGLTISQISDAEGLSESNVAKLCRLLRIAGFITSTRGQTGGYTLAKPAHEIHIDDILNALGGRLFKSDFCDNHTGVEKMCTHSVDCSIRSLWQVVQLSIDQALHNLTLQDLISSENEFVSSCVTMVDISDESIKLLV